MNDNELGEQKNKKFLEIRKRRLEQQKDPFKSLINTDVFLRMSKPDLVHEIRILREAIHLMKDKTLS